MKKLSSQESLHGASQERSARHPSFGEAFLFWLKLGFISFGGPTGQIAIMHAELVEKKKWITHSRLEKQGFQPKMELAKRKNLGLCFPYYDQTTGSRVFVFE